MKVYSPKLHHFAGAKPLRASKSTDNAVQAESSADTTKPESVDTGALEVRETILDANITEKGNDFHENGSVFERRALFNDYKARLASVEGVRSLSGFSSMSEAGFAKGGQFFITIGESIPVRFKVDSKTRVSVTQNEIVENVSFGKKDGSFQSALVDALNKVKGLNAAINSEGRLELATKSQSSLTIIKSEDSDKGILSALGLKAGKVEVDGSGYRSMGNGEAHSKIDGSRLEPGSRQLLDGANKKVKGFTEEISLVSSLGPASFGTSVSSLESIKTLFNSSGPSTPNWHVNSSYKDI